MRQQVRRGPDYQAVEVVRETSPAVVFGHDRLSIIDLSEAANQPFHGTDGRYSVTFNGEIYNYRELREDLIQLGKRFRTSSDTEVLVEAFAAWGVEAFQRFNGMFAFAIVDRQSGRVWLVRDRFGVKPLYYAHPSPQELIFASTTEVISRELKLEPDYGYLSDGIRWLIYEDGSARTAFKDLKSVEPGCYVEIRGAGNELICEPKRYYDLRSRVEQRQAELAGASEKDLIKVVEEQLRDAVCLRLRSDVPVGISLSGGIDSSLIAALAVQEGAQLTGVSFGDPKRKDSEGPLVEEIAKHLGIAIHYVWPNSNTAREAVWEALQAQGIPFPGLSIVAQYLVFKTARAAGLKVMLGGQGGDEAFMGYRKYLYMTLVRREHLTGIFSDLVGLAKVFGRELPRLSQNIASAGTYMDARETALELQMAKRSLGLDSRSPVRWRQLRDLIEVSIPTLLRYEDSNSMGNSVESRLPFLDYRVVETGLALPDRIKVREGYPKWVLRSIARRLLPASVVDNRLKTGFDPLAHRWITSGVGGDLRRRLYGSSLEVAGNSDHSLINSSFSDKSLSSEGCAFGEAITAIWLLDQSRKPEFRKRSSNGSLRHSI